MRQSDRVWLLAILMGLLAFWTSVGLLLAWWIA